MFDSHQILERIIAGGILLLITWTIGQRIMISWHSRKASLEMSLRASHAFHRLQAELRTVGRLLRAHVGIKSSMQLSAESHSALFERAVEAEGQMEALLIQLANEFRLSKEEVAALGFQREIFQELRKAVRDNRYWHFKSNGRVYTEIYRTCAIVVSILARPCERLGPAESYSQLIAIHRWSKTEMNKLPEDRGAPPSSK